MEAKSQAYTVYNVYTHFVLNNLVKIILKNVMNLKALSGVYVCVLM